MMNIHLRSSLFFLMLFLSQLAQSAEWNGGEKWDLFDCSDRRAMWVWNPAAVTGTKAENRAWDPTPTDPRNAQARFFANYKGSRDLFFDFCENKSIRVLYFYNAVWEWNLADLDKASPTIPNEAAFASFVAEANSRGIQVWLMCYLWDDPDDSRMTIPAQKQSMKRLAEAVHRFNIAHPTTPVAGIHVDQEPSDISVYDDLLDTMKIAQDWVDANSPNIMISQALRPKWRNQNLTWNGATKTMNQHVMDTIGHGAYMSYNDNINTVKNWLTPIIDYATANHKKIASGYGDYFKHWFGEHPRDYILNLPAGEYVSATQNPAKVNLHQDTRPLIGIAKFVGAPTANAGADQIIFDTDSTAGESVSLNANASADSDGNIVSYQWKNNGVVIAAIATPTVNLADGVHTLTLTVTDNDGKSGTDTIVITVKPVGVTPNDGDGNGLNDQWENTHFGSTGSVAADVDHDGHGFTTFEEMVFGLNPNERDPANAHLGFKIIDDAGVEKVEFKFRRPLNFASLDVIYQLETCTNLSNDGIGKWTANTTVGTLTDDGTIQWVTYLLPLNLDKSFYRCKVSPIQ